MGGIAQGSEQFGRRDAGSAKLPNYDPRSNVGKHNSLGQGSAGRDGQCEHGEDRVARSGDVEDLASAAGALHGVQTYARVTHLETRGRNVEVARRGFLEEA